MAFLGIVLRKELLDGIRDRRSIISALIPLLFLPVMIFFLVKSVSDRIAPEPEMTVRIVGEAHARALVDWLGNQPGIQIEPGPDDYRRSVRDGDTGFVVAIPEDFASRFARSKTAEVEIVVDSRDSDAERDAGRVRGLLREYGQLIASQRLLLRGVSPEVVRPLAVETIDMATDRELATRFLMFMPMMLIMGAFIGGLQIAIDSTSGERERRTLEALLSKPVSPLSVVGGKWLASTSFAAASVVLSCGLLVLSLEIAPLHRMGIRPDLGARAIASLLLAVLPLVPLASGLQMAIATLARSYKEAQSYVSFLMLLPVMPMLLMPDPATEQAAWKLLVPVLGQYILILEVFKGSVESALTFAVPSLVSIAGSLAALWLTARLFRSERIVFGR